MVLVWPAIPYFLPTCNRTFSIIAITNISQCYVPTYTEHDCFTGNCLHVYASVCCLLVCAYVLCVMCVFMLQSMSNLALHTEPYRYSPSSATSCRSPVHSERPTAADILGDFCKSERVLLGWRVEDTVPLLSRMLGAPLSEGETLHRDLQNKYKGSLAKQ